MKTARFIATLVVGAILAFPAFATELKIGLQDDADVLDPAQSRTFVGRIVYTALCDKLVDVNQNWTSCRNLPPNGNGRKTARNSS